jgi:hypothetical protein
LGPRLHWVIAATAVLFAPPAAVVTLIATRGWGSSIPAWAMLAAYLLLVAKLWRKGGDAGRAWRWIARPALVLVFPAWGVAAILAVLITVSVGAELVDPAIQRTYLSRTLALDIPTEATPLLARDARIGLKADYAMVILDADPALIAKWYVTFPREARARAKPEPAAEDRTHYNWLLPCDDAAPTPDEISARAQEALDAFCTPERWDPKAKLVELDGVDGMKRLAFILLSPGRRAILILRHD